METELIPRFRKATLGDAPTIQRFQQSMAWETEKLKLDPAVLQKGVRAVFDNPGLGQYHVGAYGERVVGSLLLTTEWSDWRNGTVWWIHSLYFEPEFRGRRLFSQMYRYVRELAENDGNVRGLRLYVDHANSHAQKVYEALGMNGDHYRLFEWMKVESAPSNR